MYGIGKIDDGRTLRKGDYVALRGEDKDLVVHYVDLESLKKFLRVARVVFRFYELCDPAELSVDILPALLAGFVFPVSGDTVFGYLVHFPCPYLHLERYRVPAHYGGMERAVHIRLRRGDIILEPSGDHAEHLVYESEDDITLLLGIHNDPESVEVEYLIKALVLLIHFPVYAVYRFHASFKNEVYPRLGQLVRDLSARLFDEIAAFAVALLDILPYFLVSDGIKVFKREIFKLLLHPLHTETVSKRRKDLHCFKRGHPALCILLDTEGAHIVEPVAELYENDPYVLRHGKKHLAEVLDVLLLLVLERDLHHFGQPVDK